MSDKNYTVSEVHMNNGKNGSPTWIIFKNSVYDVTEFLAEHPGGAELIEEYAGRDATKAYNEAGHSTDANQMLKKYKIGDLILSNEPKLTCPVLGRPPKSQSVTFNDEKVKQRTKFFFCF